jgi:dihydrofolate reductase
VQWFQWTAPCRRQAGREEDPTGGFKFGGWTAPLADTDPVFGEEIGKLLGQSYDLLLDRRTYDIFAAYWPYAEGDIAKQFNRRHEVRSDPQRR